MGANNSHFFRFFYMNELIDYIKKGQTKDEHLPCLLALYAKAPGFKRNMHASMQRSERSMKTYLRYEVWKLLPAEMKEEYGQDLKKKHSDEDPETEEPKDDGKDTDPKDEGKELEPKDDTKAEEQPREIAPLAEEVKAFAIQEKAKHYNQRAKLSNSLADFAEDDNPGRKEVVEKIAVIDARMSELDSLIEGKPVPEYKPKPQYKWLRTDEEIAAMTAAELKNYRSELTNARGKASSAHKKGEKLAENQLIMDTIDQIRLKLG